MKQKSPILLHFTTVPMTFRAFLVSQLNYFSRNGFEVHLISSPGADLDFIKKQYHTLYVHGIKMNRSFSPFHDFISLIRLVFMISVIKPDIVHTHTPKASFLGLIAAFVNKVPVRIFHIHGFVNMTAKGILNCLFTFFDKLIIRLSTQTFCVSNGLKQKLIQDKIIEPYRIKVMGNGSINGVDSEHRFNPQRLYNHRQQALKKDLGISSEYIVIGYVGRIVKDKGITDLYGAWIRLKKKYDYIVMLFIGPVEKRDCISGGILKKIMDDQEIFMINLKWDIEKYYSIIDIFVLPSYREGFPVTPLEASAMEIPVITTDISGCNEAVLNNFNGLLIQPGDIEELVEAIEKLILDPDLRIKLGKNGRERVKKLFKPKEIWKATLKEYECLLRL